MTSGSSTVRAARRRWRKRLGRPRSPSTGSDAKRELRGARKVEPAAPKAVEAQPIGPADEPVFNADAAAGDSGADAPAEPEKPKPKAKSKSKSKKRDAQPPAQSAPPPGGDPGLF